MTKTHHSIVEQPDERGSALIGVLLLLMMMSALAAALAVSGQTETLISGNQRTGAQAHLAAEAGLNHAVEVATTYIFNFKANGFGTAGQAVNALLRGPDNVGDPNPANPSNADNRSLGARDRNGDAVWEIAPAAAIPLGAHLQIENGIVEASDASIISEYEASIRDDAGIAVGEEAIDDPLVDLNRRLIVTATGYGPNNTRVVLEAIINPFPLPGVVTNGNLAIDGNAVTIDGASGGVHSNDGLAIKGNGDDLGGTLSTSGAYSGPDDIGVIEGRPELVIPEVHASDYLAHADFILTSDGTMTDQAGNWLCTYFDSPKAPCNNWSFNNGLGEWSFNNASTPPTGTYYVEGDVDISGGTVELSIIAEGSIKISGSPTLTPHTPELLFVTDEDLKITGSLDAMAPDINVQGQMLVHGQIDIFGKIQLAGQLLVEDADVGDLVPTGGNSIGGNVHISYNGTLGGAVYSVTGWREVRQP